MKRGNNAVRDIFATEVVEFLIDEFKNHDIMRLYKRNPEYNSDDFSFHNAFDINNYSEFRAVLFSIEPDSVKDIQLAPYGDIGSLHKLYTTEPLHFECHDLVAEGDPKDGFFFEILSVDGSINYQTLILKGRSWT